MTMIQVTRLDGSELVINALLIERIEATPDTIISLTTGRQYVVKEECWRVKSQIVEYLRRIHCHTAKSPLPTSNNRV